MAGFGAFLTQVFLSLAQKEEKNRRFLILQLFLILLVIIQIIHIYIYYMPIIPHRIFFAADLSTG